MPMVTCDFDVPKDYNSTAEIRPGDCENFREFASGPLTQSGKVRATLYQEVTAEERRSVKFVKNFCARSDVFFDVNGEKTLIKRWLAICPSNCEFSFILYINLPAILFYVSCYEAGSGNQTSVSMTKVNVVITFTVESQSQYLLNVKTTSVEPDKQTRAWFSVLGSLIGVFVVTIMVVLFMKKRGEYHGKRNEQMGKMAGVNISEIMIHEAAFV